MNDTDLKTLLKRIDRRGYPAYKDTKGVYTFPDYVLSIDHVQGDPFASPSKLHVEIAGNMAAFDASLFDTPWRRVALEDFLLRAFAKEAMKRSFEVHGSGKSGLIAVSTPGQEVLQRSAIRIGKDGKVILRFRVGFPARGRSVLAEELIQILFEILPDCIRRTLFSSAYDKTSLQKTADLSDDRKALRDALDKKGLVAFVADGSILPRQSGISDKPMKQAVPFVSPDSLAVIVDLPHRGEVRGLGIAKGVTLIVGGGYHGKSTLLKALERGVYDHIAGDGRELVVTDESAVKLRAEDGRSIQNTDISMFIRNLPNGKDTVRFFTEDASGSTSQAANTVEAIAAGAKTLLIDEDTSATNFMIRDALMQRVVHREEEPIIPFVDRVVPLYRDCGISTILVAGSSGAYFEKADCVIRMKEYLPLDITEMAKKEAALYLPPEDEVKEAESFFIPDENRPVAAHVQRDRHGRIKTKTFGKDGFSIGKENVDLRYVEQIVDPELTNAILAILVYFSEHEGNGKRSITELVEGLYLRIAKDGFRAFDADRADHLAMPRKQEVYAAINRCRECFRIG